jgi:hypothetical protein
MHTITLALAITCCATLARAQVPVTTRPVQLVISGGVQVPTGGFGDWHDLGTHYDASLIINALGRVRLRPELTYARFKVKEALAVVSAQRNAAPGGAGAGAARDLYGDALSSVFGGIANLEVPLGPQGFQPFLLAGLGAVQLKSDATSAADALSEVKATVNLGAGVRFRLGGIGGLIEARFNNVPAGDNTSAYFSDVRTIPVTIGLVF